MSLESKLKKTAKFAATGIAGTAACMAAGYGLGELLQGTHMDTGLQELFHAFNSEYYDLRTLLTFIGFTTGLKLTSFLEFYNLPQKIKNKFKKPEILETKIKKTKEPFTSTLKTLGTYFICAGVGLGLGKMVGETFEYFNCTNQAFTYLFNTFADVHFKDLGDLFTLLGMIWGFRMKPQLNLLYTYLTDKEKYYAETGNQKIYITTQKDSKQIIEDKKMAMKPKTVDELYKHRGDIVQVDGYASIKDRILGRKVKGRMEIPTAWEDEEHYKEQKDLIWAINNPNGDFYRFRTVKEGYTLDGILDEITKGPLDKEMREKERKKELMPLEKVTILECYHKDEKE